MLYVNPGLQPKRTARIQHEVAHIYSFVGSPVPSFAGVDLHHVTQEDRNTMHLLEAADRQSGTKELCQDEPDSTRIRAGPWHPTCKIYPLQDIHGRLILGSRVLVSLSLKGRRVSINLR